MLFQPFKGIASRDPRSVMELGEEPGIHIDVVYRGEIQKEKEKERGKGTIEVGEVREQLPALRHVLSVHILIRMCDAKGALTIGHGPRIRCYLITKNAPGSK